MIDTVALTLKPGFFRVQDHARFTPSTAGLFGDTPYLIGQRGYMKCVQNPSRAELEGGVLLRVSITKSTKSTDNSRKRFSYGFKPCRAQTKTTISRCHTYFGSPTKRPTCSRVLNLMSNDRF